MKAAAKDDNMDIQAEASLILMGLPKKRGERSSLFKSQRFTPFYISIVAIGPEMLVSFNRKHVFNISKVKQIMFFSSFM